LSLLLHSLDGVFYIFDGKGPVEGVDGGGRLDAFDDGREEDLTSSLVAVIEGGAAGGVLVSGVGQARLRSIEGFRESLGDDGTRGIIEHSQFSLVILIANVVLPGAHQVFLLE
jgi:hypothetical protein